MTSAVTQLKVDDEQFLVASLIDRCPKTMMLRELVQNAIEAVSRAPVGQQRVVIDVIEIDGGRKLRITNGGPGMDEPNLYRMCDIASSIGKLKGLDQNFGMGAKVASLPSNHLGVRYRSCCDGQVHEIIIGKRQGVYGRVLRPKGFGGGLPGRDRMVDILEITQQAEEEGYDLSKDWTEVTLLGMRPDQDTAFDPYDGDPAMPPFWLPEALYHRYFRIPAGVEVSISADYLWRSEAGQFQALAERAKTDFAGYECVTTSNGTRMHYFYDPSCPTRPWENGSSEGALQTAMGQVGLVYRDEIYDRRNGSPWAYDAPEYGITFGARNMSVFIELPESYPVRPDAYRQLLMRKTGDQTPLSTKDFAKLVLSHRPDWLVEMIESLGGQKHGIDAVLRNLSGLCSTLELNALSEGDSEEEKAEREAAKAEIAAQPEGHLARARAVCGFDILLLHNEQDINDRWLGGRAACFYKATKQLFINAQYGSIGQMQKILQGRLADLPFSALRDEAIERVAVESIVTRISRALLFGISKHKDGENWQDGHIEKAISPEALSIAADDFYDFLPWAEGEVRERVSG